MPKYFIDIGFEGINKLEDPKEKAIQLAITGLGIDGGHHKQWFLEEILKALDVDLKVLKDEMEEQDYEWEEGIAP